MKIFLTGEMQVGKSTLVSKVVRHCEAQCRIGGFRTITVPDIPDAIGSVYIVPVLQAPQYYDARNRVGIRHSKKKGATAFPETFDTEGVRIIEEGRGSDLFVMDEIGVLEREARRFAAAVMERIDSCGNILGVLKPKRAELLDAIRSHPGVCLLEVREDNRDALFDEIIRQLAGA